MKKKKIKPCPQLISNKKKEMLKIVQNPEAMKRVLELQQAASKVIEEQGKLHAFDLDDWFERAANILPDEYQTDEFKAKFENFIKETKNATQSE